MPLPTPYLKVIERALMEAVDSLSRSDSPKKRALLIEARRLHSAIGTWHAIPPEPEIQAEMLARVKALTATVGAASMPPPPPDSQASMPNIPSGPSGYAHLAAESTIAPGITQVRPGALEWRAFRNLAGVMMKPVHHAEGEELYSAIVRIDAGYEIPRRRHAGAEDMVILEGSMMVGGTELRVGDACHAEPGSVHEPLRTLSGCTFFVVGSMLDELLH
jgi:ChrR Cupin-like domain